MKRYIPTFYVKIFTVTLFLISLLCLTSILTGCSDAEQTVITAQKDEDEKEPEKVSFLADFYDNNGSMWLSVKGTTFTISPNKIKEYYFDTSGDWTYHYTMSSIMSIEIDGKPIESCGSTIIFADSRLQKLPIELPCEVVLSEGRTATISTPYDLSMRDSFTLDFWWYTKELNNHIKGSKIVIVQSQNGDNICAYTGNEITWDVPRNLPKTTEVTIDGMPLYIHRANFAVIDKSLFDKVAN